jgi:hypothetical protein
MKYFRRIRISSRASLNRAQTYQCQQEKWIMNDLETATNNCLWSQSPSCNNEAGLPDFSYYIQLTKTGKIYQITLKYTQKP